MTFSIKVKVDNFSDEFIASSKSRLASAATGAMKDVADNAKSKGRASIAANGFTSGWQQALRSVVYPKNKNSLGPAAIIYHKIPYAGVFEQPSSIQAKSSKYLWIPVPGVSLQSIGGRKKITPRYWISRVSNLQFVQAPSGALLVVKDKGKTNNSGLKAGTPVFFGVTSVQLRKKFNIFGITQTAASNMSSYFDSNFQKDNN